jgi:hypothetical protein
VFMASQPNAFMTTRLFELWAREVFFPAADAGRAEFGYRGRALPLLDGLGSHHPEEFLGACAERGIDVLFLVPHSSDQTHPLDLLPFGLMKRHFSGSKFSPLELGRADPRGVVRVERTAPQYRDLHGSRAGPLRGDRDLRLGRPM